MKILPYIMAFVFFTASVSGQDAPIRWSKADNLVDVTAQCSLEVRRIEYEMKTGVWPPANQIFLLAQRQTKEGVVPYVIDKREGFASSLEQKDLTGDSVPEIIWKYHAGAYQTIMEIYSIDTRNCSLTKIEGQTLISNMNDIKFTDGNDGSTTITTVRHMRFETREPYMLHSTFSIKNNEIILLNDHESDAAKYVRPLSK